MASLSNLPQELVAKIIAEFRGDATTLRSCALVSRSFLPWSRLHLFSSVRLTGRNIYAFLTIVVPSPEIAMFVRRLYIPIMPSYAILPPESLARTPNVTHISTHCDPFGFRHLSANQKIVLAGATRQLTSVYVLIDRLWTLPEWAALLNGCSALKELAIHGESTARGWSAQEVVLRMPTAACDSTPCLHTLRISGDCKILAPLEGWLVPSGFLTALHTLAIDVLYLQDDYDAPDHRPPIVLAAAPHLEDLTLHLDPPMPLAASPHPISLSSFPSLRALHLTDGPDADIGESLFWLGLFLASSSSPAAAGLGALEEISVDHSMIRRDLLAVPADTWHTLEAALLLADSPMRFRTLTFKGYQKFSIGAPDAFIHFSTTVRGRLPGLHERGALRIVK
ncbi:hypothetical protein B0H11DRAFT_1994070 [Mycena galericulata]|nr:hypothetical protein B0H11DRAFT_2037285 [Mycena galericulata]KAJ7501221.1 hypothetical protein B0H11DRAFT_1994070 [Mycena galericulata]